MKITLNNRERQLNDIVQQVTQGDRRAFRAFYDRKNRVFRFVHYFVPNNEDCEEVVSEVFCALWKNRISLVHVQNIEAYIYIVSRNEAYRFVKQTLHNENMPIDEMPVELFVQEDSIEQTLIATELLQSYQEAVASLPERCKLIFLMVREEHLKYKEIAQILAISEGTIETQMNIAIKKLISVLNRHYPSLRIKQRYS